MDGDVTDPSGTLSGGARQKGGSILLELKEIKTLEVSKRNISIFVITKFIYLFTESTYSTGRRTP